jgi:hypothetical protein
LREPEIASPLLVAPRRLPTRLSPEKFAWFWFAMCLSFAVLPFCGICRVFLAPPQLLSVTAMKNLIACLPLLALSGNALSQACWSEWERNGQWLIRAGKCTENVSIPDIERLCKSRVKSDEPRTAASCPKTVQTFNKGSIETEPQEFRCMGLRPPAAGGTANTFHYGLSKNPQELDVVRDLCVQFGGKWEIAK